MDTNQLLTEHFGCAPLSLVDRVINDANVIMENCLNGLEQFLLQRRDAQLRHHAPAFPLDEIKTGVAELETFLVLQLDRSFDRFESYALGTVFAVPSELVTEGWFRLRHHDSLEQADSNKEDLALIVADILLQLDYRRMLSEQRNRARSAMASLQRSKSAVEGLLSPNLDALLPQLREILREQLFPLKENLYYIFKQVELLVTTTLEVAENFDYEKARKNIAERRQARHEALLAEKTERLVERELH